MMSASAFIVFMAALAVVICILMLPLYIKFNASNYKNASGNGFLKTVFNKGNYGEYLTYAYLEKLDGHNKIMTNLYLPKKDEKTTEIDLLMLSPSGIYVFESKNYSGWIFGDEKSKYWTQSLPNKQKNKFFNPIWQNKGHITALKDVLGAADDIIKSYIIFSERCTLKKINVSSPNVKVIKRNQLYKTIKKDTAGSPNVLTPQEVNALYFKLLKYTRVDESIKRVHVENIRTER